MIVLMVMVFISSLLMILSGMIASEKRTLAVQYFHGAGIGRLTLRFGSLVTLVFVPAFIRMKILTGKEYISNMRFSWYAVLYACIIMGLTGYIVVLLKKGDLVREIRGRGK